jgi:hypothetical protein
MSEDELVKIYCVCGKEVPMKVIGDDEPDKEVKEYYRGKIVLMCYNCYTITEVSGTVKKAIDEACEIAKLSGQPGSVTLS